MLSWTSDPFSINPSVLTGAGNNTHGCAESGQPATLTEILPGHTKTHPDKLTAQNKAKPSGQVTALKQ